MLQFNCLGIPVRVEPFFWLTMALLGAMNTGLGGGSTPNEILLILLFVLAGFISILVHELGHAFTARRFGAQSDIILYAFGGVARHRGAHLTRMRSILITAAGPGYQFALGLLVIGLARALPPLSTPAESFLLYLIVISLFWSLFNLLPIVPMDGGQILQAALGPARIRITLGVSIGTCAVLALVALFGVHPSQPYIAIFMGFFGYQSWKRLKQNSWR